MHMKQVTHREGGSVCGRGGDSWAAWCSTVCQEAECVSDWAAVWSDQRSGTFSLNSEFKVTTVLNYRADKQSVTSYRLEMSCFILRHILRWISERAWRVTAAERCRTTTDAKITTHLHKTATKRHRLPQRCKTTKRCKYPQKHTKWGFTKTTKKCKIHRKTETCKMTTEVHKTRCKRAQRHTKWPQQHNNREQLDRAWRQ